MSAVRQPGLARCARFPGDALRAVGAGGPTTGVRIMDIRITCPSCNTPLKAPESCAGKNCLCTSCKSTFVLDVSVLIDQLGMRAVNALHLHRESLHQSLRRYFDDRAVHEFVQLALGISDPEGNCTASEKCLSPKILARSTEDDVFTLAFRIEQCPHPHLLPALIFNQHLPYLKIGVGSEIAMMLQPDLFWVCNVRTIWAHLLLKHNSSLSRANEELALYRDDEDDSEMAYRIWQAIYVSGLGPNLGRLGDLASQSAARKNIPVDPRHCFLWADAVANELFKMFANPKFPRWGGHGGRSW